MRSHPPIITSSDCEGAGEVFTVSAGESSRETDDPNRPPQEKATAFFREPKFLTVSSQLHLEAFVHEHPKVWTLSPTFRAEKSDTPRHLSEFWMLEAEMRTESLEDIMTSVEGLIRSLVISLSSTILLDQLTSQRPRNDFEDTDTPTMTSDDIRNRWRGLQKHPWPRISYTEAIQLLTESANAREVNFRHKPAWGEGLQPEHERFIAMKAGSNGPVFVTDYPSSTKPFYMLPTIENSAATHPPLGTVACFDLLLPEIGEIVGGSLREHRLQPLLKCMQKLEQVTPSSIEHLIDSPRPNVRSSGRPENLDWYIDLRRYGSVPHGGFGLGFDRLLGYLTGVRSIRDIVPWPRYYGRCDC